MDLCRTLFLIAPSNILIHFTLLNEIILIKHNKPFGLIPGDDLWNTSGFRSKYKNAEGGLGRVEEENYKTPDRVWKFYTMYIHTLYMYIYYLKLII